MENETGNMTGQGNSNESHTLGMLKEKADFLKRETETLINAAKELSKVSFKDAEKFVDFAKENWKSILGVAAALGMGGAVMTKGKSSAKKSGKSTTKNSKGTSKAKAKAKKSPAKKRR